MRFAALKESDCVLHKIPMNNKAIITTENDICLRLVEVWYDCTWAYFMSEHVGDIKRRLLQRSKHLSSAASVASSVDQRGGGTDTWEDKMNRMENILKNVRERLRYTDFKELCESCLENSDKVYPGFGDVMGLTRRLLVDNNLYKGKLTDKDISQLSLPMVFQSIYYHLCDHLLETRTGADAFKLLITPSKIKHATYEICRQKFCRIMVDEDKIIRDGLQSLIKKIVKYRQQQSSRPKAPRPVPAEPVAQDPPVSPSDDQCEEESVAMQKSFVSQVSEKSAYAPYAAPRAQLSETPHAIFPPIKFDEEEVSSVSDSDSESDLGEDQLDDEESGQGGRPGRVKPQDVKDASGYGRQGGGR